MKITPECIPCLIKRVIFEAGLVSETLVPIAVKEACKVFAKNYEPNINSAVLATKVHRRVYQVLGNPDPYAEMKEWSNRVALKLVKKVENIIANSDDKLSSSALCSIVGNVLDFGIQKECENPDELFKKFDSIYSEGLAYNDIPLVKKYITNSNVIFFADNCGEIIFDKILCREMKEFGSKITFVVKGKPMLSDATIEDAYKYKLDEVCDEILTTNSNAVGIDFSCITPKLKSKLKKASIIISKGMANFESLSDEKYRPIAYLLRTKCIPVANALNAEWRKNVVKVLRI
ncbi:MAG: ARMT1-like domain-containing protein [Candidatus Thermoplasmatota archaeon]